MRHELTRQAEKAREALLTLASQGHKAGQDPADNVIAFFDDEVLI